MKIFRGYSSEKAGRAAPHRIAEPKRFSRRVGQDVFVLEESPLNPITANDRFGWKADIAKLVRSTLPVLEE